MLKLTLLLLALCVLAHVNVNAKHFSSSSSSSSSSDSSSSSLESCGSSSSSSESSESKECGRQNKHHHHKSRRHHKSAHEYHCNWKWNLDAMTHREIEDLKAWGKSHGISWTQMEKFNDYYKVHHGNCGGTSDIEGLCGAHNSSKELDCSSNTKNGGSMKCALHAMSLFEEFKRADNIQDAFRRLKKLCDYVDSIEENSNVSTEPVKQCNRTNAIGCTQQQQQYQQLEQN